MTDEIKNAANLESDRGPAQPKDQSRKAPQKSKPEGLPKGEREARSSGADKLDGARGGDGKRA